MHMRTEIVLTFQTADGLKLYRQKFCGMLGNFIAQNKKEFLSIVGAILVDLNSSNPKDNEWATLLFEQLDKNQVFLIEENMLINLKGIV